MFCIDMNEGGRYSVTEVKIVEGECVFMVDFMGSTQEVSAHECKPVPMGVMTW